MDKPRTYDEVAEFEGLSEETGERFITYMRFRWPSQEISHCRFGYAQEWAERFKYGKEYECSDKAGRIVLNNVVDYEAPIIKNY